jgi:hypothetical protein
LSRSGAVSDLLRLDALHMAWQDRILLGNLEVCLSYLVLLSRSDVCVQQAQQTGISHKPTTGEHCIGLLLPARACTPPQQPRPHTLHLVIATDVSLLNHFHIPTLCSRSGVTPAHIAGSFFPLSQGEGDRVSKSASVGDTPLLQTALSCRRRRCCCCCCWHSMAQHGLICAPACVPRSTRRLHVQAQLCCTGAHTASTAPLLPLLLPFWSQLPPLSHNPTPAEAKCCHPPR